MENTNTQTYAIGCRMYAGQENPEASFTFKAKSPEEAVNRAAEWARYHGLTFYRDEVNASRSDVFVREPRGCEVNWTPKT